MSWLYAQSDIAGMADTQPRRDVAVRNSVSMAVDVDFSAVNLEAPVAVGLRGTLPDQAAILVACGSFKSLHVEHCSRTRTGWQPVEWRNGELNPDHLLAKQG